MTADYQLGPDQGTLPPRDYVVGAGRRATLRVPGEVGPDKDVSVKLTCPSPFLAERPISLRLSGLGGRLHGRPLRHRGDAARASVALRGGLHRARFPDLAVPARTPPPNRRRWRSAISRRRGALPTRRVVAVPAKSRTRVTLRSTTTRAGPAALHPLASPPAGILARAPRLADYVPSDTITITAVGTSATWTRAPCESSGCDYAWESVGETCALPT